MIERIETHLHVGDKIDVKGVRTATVGDYLGVVLTDVGEPMIALGVNDNEVPVVYAFDEVKSIEHVEVVTGRDTVREFERAAP